MMLVATITLAHAGRNRRRAAHQDKQKNPRAAREPGHSHVDVRLPALNGN